MRHVGLTEAKSKIAERSSGDGFLEGFYDYLDIMTEMRSRVLQTRRWSTLETCPVNVDLRDTFHTRDAEYLSLYRPAISPSGRTYTARSAPARCPYCVT